MPAFNLKLITQATGSRRGFISMLSKLGLVSRLKTVADTEALHKALADEKKLVTQNPLYCAVEQDLIWSEIRDIDPFAPKIDVQHNLFAESAELILQEDDEGFIQPISYQLVNVKDQDLKLIYDRLQDFQNQGQEFLDFVRNNSSVELKSSGYSPLEIEIFDTLKDRMNRGRIFCLEDALNIITDSKFFASCLVNSSFEDFAFKLFDFLQEQLQKAFRRDQFFYQESKKSHQGSSTYLIGIEKQLRASQEQLRSLYELASPNPDGSRSYSKKIENKRYLSEISAALISPGQELLQIISQSPN